MTRAKRANLMVEYAIVLGLITTAVILMQTYIKRGIQGTIKATADQLGVSAEAYYAENNINLDSQSLGAWEKGLFTYSTAGGSDVTENVTVSTETNLKEAPLAAGQPIRTNEIKKDQTQTSGVWQTTYRLEDEGTFSASNQTKKPGEGVSGQAGEAKVGSDQGSSNIIK